MTLHWLTPREKENYRTGRWLFPARIPVQEAA